MHYETCIYHLSFNFRIVFKSFYIFDWISNSQFDNVIKITENILCTCVYIVCLGEIQSGKILIWHAFFVQSQTLFLTILVQASSVIRLSQQSIHFSDPFHINSRRNYRKILPLRAREGKKLVPSRSQNFKSNIHSILCRTTYNSKIKKLIMIVYFIYQTVRIEF